MKKTQVVAEPWVPTADDVRARTEEKIQALDPSTFGGRLTLLRLSLDLSLRALAELCGIDDQRWRNWESGAVKSPQNMNEVVDRIVDATRPLLDRPLSSNWLMWNDANHRGQNRPHPSFAIDAA